MTSAVPYAPAPTEPRLPPPDWQVPTPIRGTARAHRPTPCRATIPPPAPARSNNADDPCCPTAGLARRARHRAACAASRRWPTGETTQIARAFSFQPTHQSPKVPSLFLVRDHRCRVESRPCNSGASHSGASDSGAPHSGAQCQRVCAALLPMPSLMISNPVLRPASAASCKRRPAVKDSGFCGAAITKPTAPDRKASSADHSRSASSPACTTINREQGKRHATPAGSNRSVPCAGPIHNTGPAPCRAIANANADAPAPPTSWTRNGASLGSATGAIITGTYHKHRRSQDADRWFHHRDWHRDIAPHNTLRPPSDIPNIRATHPASAPFPQPPRPGIRRP